MEFPVHTVGTLESDVENGSEISITLQLGESSCIRGINIPILILSGLGRYFWSNIKVNAQKCKIIGSLAIAVFSKIKEKTPYLKVHQRF